MGEYLKGMPSSGKPLPRAFLIPSFFVVIVLCLWTAFTVLPFSMVDFCLSGRRLHCLPFKTSSFREMDRGSSLTSAVMLNTQALKLQQSLQGLEENNLSLRAAVERIMFGETNATPRLTNTSSVDNDNATKEVTRIMEHHRSTAMPRRNARQESEKWLRYKNRNYMCDGRKVYIYDLPSKFNLDLLMKSDQLPSWFNTSQIFKNSGMGELVEKQEEAQAQEDVLMPANKWYETHHYALEALFHHRLKKYPCLTLNAEEADLFYVPYYGCFDVLRWYFLKNASNVQRDQLGLELVSWLNEKLWWKRNGGADHVLVLGKFSWDFRRPKETDTWGSRLLELPEMQQVTKILIATYPWHVNDVSVPLPTFFHPRTDSDVRIWQGHIDTSRRRFLVSFAGLPASDQRESIRSALIQQCNSRSDACHFLQCNHRPCLEPKSTMTIFLHSHFCLHPPGSILRNRFVFDSLIAGCIPVLFDPYNVYYQYPWHLPANGSLYSVYIPSDLVTQNKVNVIELLEKIPARTRKEMRMQVIYEIMPGLVYAEPGARMRDVDDAFDVTLRSLFWRLANRRENISSARSLM